MRELEADGHRYSSDRTVIRAVISGALLVVAVVSGTLGLSLSSATRAGASSSTSLAWFQASPPTVPGAYAQVGEAYDAASDQLIIYGGSNYNDTTWNWTGSDWSQVSLSGSQPEGESAVALAYDPVMNGGELLMYGGWNGTAASNDTWAWNGTSWSEVATTGPPGTLDSSLAYDSSTGQMLLFGGASDGNFDTVYNFTYIWDWSSTTQTGSWQELTPANSPGARGGASMQYDPLTQQMILFGGTSSTRTYYDTWGWSGSNWVLESPITYPSSAAGPLSYVAALGGLVLLTNSETWVWNGSDWVQQSVTGSPSLTEFGEDYDTSTSQLVAFGDNSGDSGSTYILGAPIVTGVSPESGSPSGGTSVTITGDGFTGTTAVKFGSTSVTPFSVNSSGTEITLISPSGTVGDTDDVTVQNYGYTSPTSSADQFSWLYPWSEPYSSSTPGNLEYQSEAYDAATQQLVLYGGDSGSSYSDDTWLWNGSTWSEQSPSSSPPALQEAAMAYDPGTSQLLLFGGYDGTSYLSQTWEWTGSTWAQETTTGPSAREGAQMAYDPVTKDLILFGGYNGSSYLSDTWAWNGTGWTELNPTTVPPGRYQGSLTYNDATSEQQLVLFGGRSSAGGLDDTWNWNGSNWAELTPSTSPPVMWGFGSGFDQSAEGILIFGGSGSNGTNTWLWNGNDWIEVDPATNPATRGATSMAYDSSTSQMVLYGGCSCSSELSDTWTLGAPTVVSVSPSSGIPSGGTAVTIEGAGFTGASAVDFVTSSGTTAADSFSVISDNEIVATSPTGTDGTLAGITVTNASLTSYNTSSDDFTWFDPWYEASPSTSPGARRDFAEAYDPTLNQLVLFGGYNGSSYLNDTWIWNGSTWSSNTTSTASPSARSGAVMAYDPATGDLLLLGGYDGAYESDTWEWTASGWQEVNTTGPGREFAGMSWDGSEMILFGGQDAAGSLGDTWEWTGSAWVELSPADSPPALSEVGMTYDPSNPASDAVLLFGGSTGSSLSSETWGWDPVTQDWTQITTPSANTPAARESPSMAYDSGSSNVVLYGGAFSFSDALDTWIWNQSQSAWVEVATGNPPSRSAAPMSYDSSTGQMVLFGGQNSSGTYLTDTWLLGPPVVSSVSPEAGLPAGGTSVTIDGSGFSEATDIYFGATAASGFTVNSAGTQITTTSPAATNDNVVDVTVDTPGGTSETSAADEFTYEGAPTVTGVSPSTGSTSGGTSVTVTGTNLYDASTVYFGTSPVGLTSNDINASGTQVTVASPAGSAGTVNVTVVTPIGTSASSAADEFTYGAVPTVTSVSPDAGPLAGGTEVTISGSNLSGATVVDFGSASAIIVTSSSTTVIVETPSGSTGSVDVRVTTSTGTSPASGADQFTYEGAPTVGSITPDSGPLAGGTAVTITGTNLTGTTAVDFGTPGATIDSATSTQLVVTSPAGSQGTVDVTVNTPVGTSPPLPGDHFTYLPVPTITSMSLSSGSDAGGTTVLIAGTGFTDPTTVDFGSAAATDVTYISPTEMSAVTPTGIDGSVYVTVTTAGGTSSDSATDEFTYAYIPAVTTVSPAAGPTSGGTTVMVLGNDFTAATTVDFGATSATFTVDSPTEITASAPAGSGTVDVTVRNVTGTSATATTDEFSYEGTPEISSIVPAAGSASGGSDVIITGSNLWGATAVDFGSDPSTTFEINSTTSITALSPPESSGAVAISVTTPIGTTAPTSADLFTYVVTSLGSPTVSSVSPSSGSSAGGTTVTISGSNFASPAYVDFGYSPASDVTVVSSGEITVVSPAGSGTENVTVTTLGGSSPATADDLFTYVPTPIVTSITPDYGSSAGGTTVVVAGTNFSPSTAVDFGNDPATSFTVDSSSSLVSVSPAEGSSTVDVVVTNDFGSSTDTTSDRFTYLTFPTITSISPTSGSVNGGTSVTLTGTGFTRITSVEFGSSAAASYTLNSSTSITTVSPPGSGTVNITAANLLGTSKSGSGDQFTYTSRNANSPGYWMAAADGNVYAFGAGGDYGSMYAKRLTGQIVGMAPTEDGDGYWLVGSNGGVYSFGDAAFYGSMGGKRISAPIVGIASTPDGKGYWLVGSDGGVYAFGDASFHGSMGAKHLNKPVVGIAPTLDGRGYWLVASDGGIFSFGDATFYGSTGNIRLNQPVVGMAVTADGHGYWMTAKDGGVFSFGDAGFYGSMGGVHINKPVVGMAASFDEKGYWLVASDGGIFSFGDAGFFGSVGASQIPSPVTSFAVSS